MKKNVINTALCLIFVALVGSCEKEGLMTFNTPADIYFSALISNTEGNHSLYHKFAINPGDSAILSVPLQMTGELKNYDREVKVVAVDVPADDTLHEAAILGTHYRILSAVVPAGKDRGEILVVAYNSIQKPEEYRLTLKLEANAHFGVKFDSIINNTTEKKKRSVLSFPIFISGEILTKPSGWDDKYGPYTEAKYRLLMSPFISGLPSRYWEGAMVDGKRVGAKDGPVYSEKMRHFLAKRFVGYPIDNSAPIYPGDEICCALYDPEADTPDGLMSVPGWRSLIKRYEQMKEQLQ